MGALEIWVGLGGGLVMDTALEVCKKCEHSLSSCPYGMAVADCPKVRDAVLKMLRGDREEDDVVEERKHETD